VVVVAHDPQVPLVVAVAVMTATDPVEDVSPLVSTA